MGYMGPTPYRIFAPDGNSDTPTFHSVIVAASCAEAFEAWRTRTNPDEIIDGLAVVVGESLHDHEEIAAVYNLTGE